MRGNDSLHGDAGDDSMVGGAGDDFYRVGSTGDLVVELASEGIDTVEAHISYTLGENVENLRLVGLHLNGTGNSLDNFISGTSGNNVLSAGNGNDTIVGSLGNDIYLFNLGSGSDLIRDVDSTVDNWDTVLFGAGITAEQLWFEQEGNDLRVSVVGTEDAFLVDDWYLGAQYYIEQFTTATGQTLLASQIDSLVNATGGVTGPQGLGELMSTVEQFWG